MQRTEEPPPYDKTKSFTLFSQSQWAHSSQLQEFLKKFPELTELQEIRFFGEQGRNLEESLDLEITNPSVEPFSL